MAKTDAFLPYFWLTWSDDLLTKNELTALQQFIGIQDWLTTAEKKQLYTSIDITAPPSRDTLVDWKSRIHQTLAQHPRIGSLFDLAFELSGRDSGVQKAQNDFLQLAQTLGLLDGEVLKEFQSPHQTRTSSHETIHRFDIGKMTERLDAETATATQRVKSILSTIPFEYHDDRDIDAYREKVYEWCKLLANEQLGSIAYPKAYGGQDDVASYFAVMEALSYHDLSLVIKFGVQFGLWGMSVQLLGTEKHHQKYLKDIGTLKLPGCFAMTETHHGSNVKGLETTATYDHQSQTFTVHTPHPGAQKEYIGNAAKHGRMATVFAKLLVNGTDYGVNAFVVPLRDAQGQTLPGIAIGDCGPKMGLNGVDNGTIRFDQVVIPKENMLDRFARINDLGGFESDIPSDNRRFFTMLGTLVGGRIGIPRSALSAAKSGLAIAIKYGDTRRQFGPDGGSETPILNYRVHQRRLLIPLAHAYAHHFALSHLTDCFLQRSEEDQQQIEALAAGMKAMTTWFARDALQECREACGGKGYLSENRIDALKNDTEIYTTFEGDNTVLMQLVAKNRLAEFRKKFGEMDASDMIGYVWDKTKTALTEKNPIARRNTTDAHLLDPLFHLQAFRYREHHLLESAAKRLKRLIDDGMDAYDAFNVAQHQMLAVARAFLERVILEQFQAAVSKTKDKKCQAAMENLCKLYALSQIETNKGWYLEADYMEGAKTKAIRKMVNQLCWELRPDAVPLAEAFAIPDALLAAPIATKP
ncbi:acyl-CoA dehydrogenase family protein [Flavobacterium caeni]|uniref:acyl-CoA oxidase n=1 Tax=Flavobacterium caeni TaxID=490189 RepID=A0A1G5BR16_9FLAO|nr:acyl-CoA dehydrogenase [Flavobacterium caeni]SCX92648.1 Acyl-coenzyme A oxidase [Flavobacterium caeni]